MYRTTNTLINNGKKSFALLSKNLEASKSFSTSTTVSMFKNPDYSDNAKHFPAIKAPMLPAETFKGKIAFVTGGGTGLGKGMSLMLSSLGAKVFITSRREEVLKSAANEITKATGNQVAYFPCDVRNAEQIEKCLDECESTLNGLPSMIINNAAGNFISPSERLSPNAMKTIIDIVLLGTLNTTNIVGKRLIKANQRASFLSIITTYAQTGSGFVLPSACAKSGIVAMTRSLAAEWCRYGLRFNGISPGPIYTEGAFSRLDPTGAFVEHSKNRIPSGRLGETEELANLACYLLSDYSSWLNGQIIDFDGGELTAASGEFNSLYSVEKEQWDQMEQLIRKSNKESKKPKL